MSAEARKSCSRCGVPMCGGWFGSVCPRCMLSVALEADREEGDENGNGSAETAMTPDLSAIPAHLERLGDYALIEELGRGGMGIVFKARQLALNRTVAVKLLLLGPLATKEAVQRFRREATAAAGLQHPNIVEIHEVGEVDGQPYFSMNYVAGRSLAELLAERGARQTDFAQSAEWCQQIAEAVHYAHQHGILHRDLKPANILINLEGRALVTDFGLARMMDEDSSLTLSGQALGSPNYMPPELAAGRHHGAQPTSDVYSLGAVLYELLTGRPPFLAQTVQETLIQIREQPPVAPRLLNRSIPQDLETICLKCLEKEPARRYPTAGEFADDLGRFLRDEPIHARPIGPMGKAWRWCRRKPVLAGMAAAVVTLLLTVTAVSVASAWRITSARKGEQREAYHSSIALANQYIEQGSIDRALETLWKCPQQYRHWEWGHLLYLCHQEAASFQAHTTNVTATVFSPDGRWLGTQDSDGLAKVWDWGSERQVFSFGSSSNQASQITFRPSGGQLAAILGTNGVAVWATTSWQELFMLRPQGGEVTTLAYSLDGARLVTGSTDGNVTVWDSTSGQELNRLVVTNQWIDRVVTSPDGRRLFAAAERAGWVWELRSGQLIRTFTEDASSPIFAAFTDDTVEHFATIDQDDRLTLWRKGQVPQHLITLRGGRRPEPVRRVFFSPDGRWMANAGDENTARVWDLATGTEHMVISERVHWVDFSRDGNRMVTHGTENWATTWDLVQARKLKVLRGHLTVVNDARLSSDGHLVASAEEGGTVKVWSAGPGRELVQDRAWQHGCAFSPDGRLIANCSWHEGVIIRSARSGRKLMQILPHNEAFLPVAFSPDSRRLVAGGSQKSAKVWDVETGQLLFRLQGHRRQIQDLAYSSDGRRIATGSLDSTAKVWDANTGDELLTLPMDPVNGYSLMGYSNMVRYVEFDAKDERLITGSTDGKVRIWNVVTGQLLATFVASAGVGEIRNPVTGQRMATFVGKSGFAKVKAHFLPDQKHLIISSGNRIEVRDLSTGRLVAEATGRGTDHAWGFSRDGRRMFTASSETPWSVPGTGHGTLEIWDIEETPRRILDRPVRESLLRLALSPDERNVASTAQADYCVHRWETFPWREEEYANSEAQGAEGGKQRSEGGDQKSVVSDPRSVVRGPKSVAEWAARVRQYARGYWRERLQAELHGVEGEPAEPRIVKIPIDRTLFPERDLTVGRNQLDLTDFYTGELGETFYGKVGTSLDHDDDLSKLPVGAVEFLGGVKFDVRGVIQLRRAEPMGGAWELATLDDPVRVDGIPVHQEATRLHLLLGTVSEGTVLSGGTVVGRLELHYADGETRSLDLVYGRDVRDWWEDPAKAAAEGTDRAKVVWRGTNPVADEYGYGLRLYMNTRDNPRPEAKIETFDFVSTMSNAGPFLIAVTVE